MTTHRLPIPQGRSASRSPYIDAGITPDEAKSMIDYWANYPDQIGVAAKFRCQRNLLLMWTLWSTAGRVSEVLSLTPLHIAPPSGLRLPNLKRRSRGYTDYKVVFVALGTPESPGLLDSLQSYIGRWGIKDQDRLFAVSPSQVWRIFTKTSQDLGIMRFRDTPLGGKRMTAAWPHLDRHGRLTDLLKRSGRDMELVRAQAGHEDFRSTLVYARTSAEDQQKAMESIPDF